MNTIDVDQDMNPEQRDRDAMRCALLTQLSRFLLDGSVYIVYTRGFLLLSQFLVNPVTKNDRSFDRDRGNLNLHTTPIYATKPGPTKRTIRIVHAMKT